MRILFGVFVFLILASADPLGAESRTDCFTVSDEALKLARNLELSWNNLAFGGAPGVNIKRPFGSSNKVADMVRILGEPLSVHEASSQERAALKTFQILLRFGKLVPGKYRLSENTNETTLISPDQIKLQKSFNFIDEVDEGAFGIDPKRPFGDGECWELDMAEALAVSPSGDEDVSCEDSFSKQQHTRFEGLHRSTLEFARALLRHATLPKRSYRMEQYMIGLWEPCSES